jgi:SAM-dependent methyltransferase
MTQRDWRAWHDAYDDPESWQAQRLAMVQERIRIALDAAPPGPVTVLALVAGQGRDLLPVLTSHPRRDEVTARLVELDPHNAEAARTAARDGGLTRVDVVTGDAALIGHYLDLAPADLVLMCGLFPHLSDDDVTNVIRHATSLTKRGGTVIWTRHHHNPDPVPQIAAWFTEEGFRQLWISDPDVEYGVGVHQYQRDPRLAVPGVRLFTFVDGRVLRPWEYQTTA